MARAIDARLLLVAASLALLLGCQQSPTLTSSGSLTVGLKAEGDMLVARGEYEAALGKYQAALMQEPKDVSLRFALGTALSHLDHREETTQQFRFVVAHGAPDMQEVRVARRWLVSAGKLVDISFTPAPAPEEQANSPIVTPASSNPVVVPGSKVKGQTPLKGKPREVKMFLESEDEAKRDMSITRTVKLGEAFEFDNVPPGHYRLIVEDPESETQLWNLDVIVTPGKDVALNLK